MSWWRGRPWVGLGFAGGREYRLRGARRSSQRACALSDRQFFAYGDDGNFRHRALRISIRPREIRVEFPSACPSSSWGCTVRTTSFLSHEELGGSYFAMTVFSSFSRSRFSTPSIAARPPRRQGHLGAASLPSSQSPVRHGGNLRVRHGAPSGRSRPPSR